MTVTVYSKPACGACVATKTALKNEGIPFEEVDISKDEAAYDFILEQGFQAAPVVFAGDKSWSGFRRDHIKALAEQFAA